MNCFRNPSYKKCPDRMSDVRAFTDYRANHFINSDTRYKNGLVTGADYRSYLTTNAVKMMNENSQDAWKRNGCGPCKNLCLGIDDSKRPGNSTEFDKNSCIPPAEFFKYVGTDGTYDPGFSRTAIPSGAELYGVKK